MGAMAEEGKVRIDKFDGRDFGFWKMQIEDYLYQKKLHEPLSETKPEKINPNDWTLLDRQALGAVRLTLAKNVAYNVMKETTTYGLIKALSNMYEQPSASNKVYLIRQLVNTKMNEGASVTDHVNEFNTILSRLVSVNIKFDDEIQALLLLSSLPESWSGTVTAVSSSTGTTKLSFEGVRDLILGEDIRRRNRGESSGSVLNVEGRGRKSERGKSKGRGRSKSRKRGTNATCWNCQQTGHFKSHCPNPKKERKQDNSVNATEEFEDDALICCVESPVESWIMDSGASFHTTPCKDLLVNFRPIKGKVHLANDQTEEIVGIGDVNLKTTMGTIWTFKDVKYIPTIKRMLISVSQLDGLGYKIAFENGQWKVSKGNLVIAHGWKKGTLYMAEMPVERVNAVTDGPNPSTLWHQRLGHMSEKGMKILASKGKIPELKNVKVDFCEPCVFGKQKRVSFTNARKDPKKTKLEMVHSDVYGPTKVPSIGGSHYYVTFIDDSTRKV